MSLTLEGKVIKILPPKSGEGRNGSWKRQEFVIETGDEYPKKVCFSTWNDKTQLVSSLNEGEKVKVSFDPSSREYNERWYTDLRAWRIEQVQQGDNNPPPPEPPPSLDDEIPPAQEPDLPF